MIIIAVRKRCHVVGDGLNSKKKKKNLTYIPILTKNIVLIHNVSCNWLIVTWITNTWTCHTSAFRGAEPRHRDARMRPGDSGQAAGRGSQCAASSQSARLRCASPPVRLRASTVSTVSTDPRAADTPTDSRMPGGKRGLVAPQNTFLENIVRRSSGESGASDPQTPADSRRLPLLE